MQEPEQSVIVPPTAAIEKRQGLIPPSLPASVHHSQRIADQIHRLITTNYGQSPLQARYSVHGQVPERDAMSGPNTTVELTIWIAVMARCITPDLFLYRL